MLFRPDCGEGWQPPTWGRLEDNGATGGWEAAAPPIGEVEGDGATGGAVGGSSPRGSEWVQIWLGSGLRPCRLASDWLQIGFRLGSDWVQIGFRLGSDLARLGAKAVQIGFRFGSARG